MLEQCNTGEPRSLQLFVQRVRDLLNRLTGRTMQATPTFQDLVDMGVVDTKRAKEQAESRR
jgi:hypothetical protein